MRHSIPLVLALLLSCCAPSPETVEITQTSLDKPAKDAILLCMAKPAEGDEQRSSIAPKFTLYNDRYYVNGSNWTFRDVGTHWCRWDDQFHGGTTFAFSLEPLNGQASKIEKLEIWHARQGELIREVIAKNPHAVIEPENGVVRGVIIIRDPGASVVVIDADLSVELPDV